MDDSTKRVLLFAVICLVIFLVWGKFFAPSPGKIEQSQKTKEKLQPKKKETALENKIPESQPTSLPQTVGPISKTAEGNLVFFNRKDFVVAFTDNGAALRHWQLKDSRFKEYRNGKLVAVDLVQTEKGKGPWPLNIVFSDSDFEFPKNAQFKISKQNKDEIEYIWESLKVRIVKQYVFDQKRTLLWLTTKIENLTEKRLKQRMVLNLFGRKDPAVKEAGFTNPYPNVATGLCYVNGELHRRTVAAIMGTESDCNSVGCGMGEGEVRSTGEVLWIGSDARYFLTAVVPQNQDTNRRCEITKLDDDIVKVDLVFSEENIEPRKSIERKFAVFAGPKKLEELDVVKGFNGEDSRLGESIEYGWFAILCRPMLWLMQLFYGWIGNWGIAIILLTILVKILTFHWNQKSMSSMRSMQALKPDMDALKAKYGDDKQRLNQEMMSLYKRHKVNPLGGCLPMLIQMPIWFALYRTLGYSQELYRSEFFGWITDLTAPDPYFVLPILMGISMFAQQAITPQTMEGAQAKMFKYFMPGMFTFMMLWLPSGLTLYIFVNTILTMVQQWYINKKNPVPSTSTTSNTEGSASKKANAQHIRGRQRKTRASGSLPSREVDQISKNAKTRRHKKKKYDNE